MAVYTNPNATSGATLTTGELVNSTIAAIEKTGEDAYARDLTLKDGATASNITVTAGAYLKVSANAVVDGLTFTNGGATPTVRVSNGGVVKNVVTTGTVSLYPYGGKIENVTANTGCYLNVYYNGVVDGGSFNGTRLEVGSTTGTPGGTIKNLVIKKTGEGEARNVVRETGSMYDCTISKGARYQVSGGLAERTIVSGAGARLYISKGTANSTMVYSGGSGCVLGGTVNDTVVFSGGSLFVSGGTVNGTVLSGNSAKLYVSQGTVNDTLVSSGGKMYVYHNETAPATLGTVTLRGKGGESGTADVVFCRIMGGTVDKIVASGGYVHIASGAVVGNLSAYAKEAIKVYVSSGGVVNGGYTSGSFEFRLENGGGTVKNLTVGPQTYLFWSAGYASGVTIASNAGQFRFYGSSNEALLIEDMTIYGSAKADSATRGLQRGVMSNCRLMSGAFMRQGGGINKNMTVAGTLHISGGETQDLTVSGYNAQIIASGGTISGARIEDYGKFTVREGATLLDPIIHMNSATAIKVGANWQYARLNVGSTGIAGGYVSGGTAGAFTSGTPGNTLEIYAWSGGVMEDMTYNWGAYVGVYSGATISGGTFNRATLSLRGGRVENIVLTSGASVIYNANGGTLDGATVSSGARVGVSSGAHVSNVNLLSGGSLYVYGNGAKAVGISADAEAYVRFSFFSTDPERTEAYLDTLANINAPVDVVSAAAGMTYTLAETGNAALAITAEYLGFTVDLVNGGTTINPFGQKYTVAADATTLQVDAYTVTAADEAKTLLEEYDAINSGDRALAWNGVTLGSGTAVTLADNHIAGNGWLEFDGVNLDSKSVIYGAAGTLTGGMNYLAQSGSVIGNFAAGAAASGTVASVKLTAFDAEFAGVTYAGGFGNVGKTENNEFVAGTIDTVLSSGAAISKDFYAGALANYAKTNTATAVGDITARIAMSVTDEVTGATTLGKIKGNVYGASAVKAGTISTSPATPIHTVGDVTLTLAAGDLTDTKCVFAGGYATGSDAVKSAPVYTVESVTATVSGGSWGLAHGGRGIFGGAMAGDNIGNSGVYAKVGDVNLTVSGGTMGNIYGGGWAQKNAMSEVGNVSITVSGGTIANIFGGGSHSTSGGTTVAGNVTITVSGGTITGNIYARGQLEGDTVANADVIFTGSTNFGCSVWGYSRVPEQNETGEDTNATLRFTTYSGTFTGDIGGFAGVTLDKNTKATFANPTEGTQTVTNTAWIFDATERSVGMTGTAFLNWTAADFTGDTITLNLATGDSNSWTLVSAASTTAYNKFDVLVDGASILSETLDLDQAIVGGAYDGWGFTNDNGTLKFAKLA